MAKAEDKRTGMNRRFKRFPLEIFPARVPNKKTTAKDIAEVMPNASGIGGAFNVKTNEALLPMGHSAYERTIRLHESLHGIYSPKQEYPDLASQAIEDCFVHQNWARTQGNVRRDELSVALNDLRTTINASKHTTQSDLDARADNFLLMTLRACAMLRGGELPHADRMRNIFNRALHSNAMQAIVKGKNVGTVDKLIDIYAEVLDLVAEGKRKAAVERLKTIMHDPRNAPSQGGETWVIKVGVGVPKPDAKGKGELEGTQDLSEVLKKAKPQVAPNKLSQNVESLLQGKGVGGIPEEAIPVMTIQNLHQTVHKRTREGSNVRLASSGLRVKAKKLAVAAVSPVPTKVFEKRLHLKGGCVLIDASGSMDITDNQLRAVVEALPMGTIAYYSGHGTRKGAIGDLVIYCDKGQMFDAHSVSGCSGMPFRHGGNAIDFQAIAWLLDQPGPRWYIGDTMFCGCDDKFVEAAHTLLNNAKARGMVKHFYNLQDMGASLGVAITGGE